jgi:hypothetical protein
VRHCVTGRPSRAAPAAAGPLAAPRSLSARLGTPSVPLGRASAAMQRGGSRGGYSKKAALEAEFLHAQLGTPELIKRLKVAPRPRPCFFCTSPCSSRLRSQGSAAPAQVVTETLEAYGDDDDAVDVAKSGEQSCAGSRAPTAALPALLFVLALR